MLATEARLSVVVPAFNEACRIDATIRTISAYVRTCCASCEIIIADDGSSDGTPDVVTPLIRDGLPVRLLVTQRNTGKGDAVRRGVAASTGDLVLMTDADLATPIDDLDRLLDAVHRGADVAVGSRALRSSRILVHQPPYREWSGRLFNLLVRATVLPGLRDTQCGFKLFRGPVARWLFARSSIDGFAFDVEILRLAVQAGYTVAEVPVGWSHVRDSRVRIVADGIQMLRDIMRIARRPSVADRRALGPGLPLEEPSGVAEGGS